MQRFTDLRVWQDSYKLALAIYRATRRFPSEERFGLTSQMRRAAISVPTNIAEGSKRHSNQDFARFLNIAEGSLAEAESLLIISRDLGLLTPSLAKSLSSAAWALAKKLHALRLKVSGASLEAGGRATPTGGAE